MPVLGRYSFIFESTGRTCSVAPFSPELGQLKEIPIVDGAVAYDCPYSGQVYILIVRNALFIKSMEHNLLPPFIMRAGGLAVNDKPKSQCEHLAIEDHSISFHNSNLRIPLQLLGIFSFFHHRVPTPDELEGCDKLFIIPDSEIWNPHCDSFARNEESMIDFEGNISEPHRQTSYVMETEEAQEMDYNSSSVTAEQWDTAINDTICESF